MPSTSIPIIPHPPAGCKKWLPRLQLLCHEFTHKILHHAAVPILVRHLDFWYVGDSEAVFRLRLPTENRPALDALIEIGMPALQPSAEHILSELDKLPSDPVFKDGTINKNVTDKQRWSVSFHRQALKKLSTDILGKDLAVVFLKKQLEQKGHGEGARKGIEYAIREIEKQ